MAVGLGVLILVGAVGLGALLAFTPGAGDLVSRAASRDAAAGVVGPSTPVPTKFADALLATEDSRFYSHHGLDLQGAVRGLIGPLTGGGDQGGATLEQQLAKIFYTGGNDGITDKVVQVGVAIKMDADNSKTAILEVYASSVYFGNGDTGLTAASEGYFGVSPAALTWAQASMLAGLVQAPTDYDPITHYALAKSRQSHVLDRLVATGHLTRAEANADLAAPLNLRG